MDDVLENFGDSGHPCPVCGTEMSEEVHVSRELLDITEEQVLCEEANFIKCIKCGTEMTIAKEHYPYRTMEPRAKCKAPEGSECPSRPCATMHHGEFVFCRHFGS